MFAVNYASPLGPLVIKSSERGITEISQGLVSGSHLNLHLAQAVEQLDKYFDGEITKFDLCLDLNGTTFQLNCWHELMLTKYGNTMSYKELAKKVANSNYSRAVANANNKNKIPIIIPCHRIVGSDGSLTGFAWGLNAKKYLLELEGAR